MNDSSSSSEKALVRRTLRTVAILVGACVLFVGVLSVIAVAVTSRAVGTRDAKEATSEPSPSAKKPLSI